MPENEPAIVFFDGECNLCNSFIDFVIRYDKNGKFKMASLQGQTAHRMLPPDFINQPQTVILFRGQKIDEKSDAIIGILALLPWPWRWLARMKIWPRCFRDAGYHWLAQFRYRLFGRRASCRQPTPAERAYFLD